MNLRFAKEVGYLKYVLRRLLWRIRPSPHLLLHNGTVFPTPSAKFFSSDVFVTDGNVDWNSEYILAKYLEECAPGGVLLDVGAHIGYYSVLLSPYVQGIYAFEPDNRNHVYLREALGILPNAEIISDAVSDVDGSCFFSDSEESSISHLSSEPTAVSVATVRLDTFVKERQLKPSVIKIDIEGYDISALRGATACAIGSSPVFLVEYTQEAGRRNSWEALEEFLSETGYCIFVVHRKDCGLFDFTYRFESVKVAELVNLDYKMIFLVAGVRRDWFEAFSAKHGQWKSTGLRRNATSTLLSKNTKV